MTQQDDKGLREQVSWALRHPYDKQDLPDKAADLSTSALVKARTLCISQGCEHSHPKACLFNTLMTLLEERIRAAPHDTLWRGCVYLWLIEAHPLSSNKGYSNKEQNKPVAITFLWNDARRSHSRIEADLFNDALFDLEESVLQSPLSPPIEQWDHSHSTVTNQIQVARRWLSKEVLSKSFELLLKEMQDAIGKTYGHFLSPGIPNTNALNLENWPLWPQLRLYGAGHPLTLKGFLEKIEGRRHIFGAPGSGKTEMSRFIAASLAREGAQRFFPLPVDARLIDINPLPATTDLVSLSMDQWCPDEAPPRDWLKALRRSSISALPIIDNWESLRAERAHFNRELYLKRQLRPYAHFLIFSRKKDLEPDHRNLNSYEIDCFGQWEIKGFLAEWGARTGSEAQMAALRRVIFAPHPPEFIKLDACNLPGLLSLCRYTTQKGQPPSSAILYLRETLDWLLEREMERLSLPPSDILDLPGILQDLAWLTYSATDGAPRRRPANSVALGKTQSLFQTSPQKEGFKNLLDSHFLILKSHFGRQRISFYNPLHQSFYAAEKLLRLGETGNRIALQMAAEEGWQQILRYRIQLLQGGEE